MGGMDGARFRPERHVGWEGFARGLSESWSRLLRGAVEVSFVEATQSAGGTPGESVDIWVSPVVLFPMIERLLGGCGTGILIPQRGLTQIESRLARRLVAVAEQELRGALGGVARVRLVEADPHPCPVQERPLPKVSSPHGRRWEAEFLVRFAGHFAPMRLSVPLSVAVGEVASMGAEAVLGGTSLSLEELRNLAVGDVILSDTVTYAPLRLSLGQDETYGVLIGQRAERRVVKVVRPADDKTAMRRPITGTSGHP